MLMMHIVDHLRTLSLLPYRMKNQTGASRTISAVTSPDWFTRYNCSIRDLQRVILRAIVVHIFPSIHEAIWDLKDKTGQDNY